MADKSGAVYLDSLYNAFKPYKFEDKEKNIARYCWQMLNKTTTMFEYENLPENISKRILERYLQCNGRTLFFKHNDKYYVSFGNWGGLPDAYYEPTIYIVNNPYIPLNKEFKIGEDCVLIRNDSCMMGLGDMFRSYATLLAENDLSIRMTDINSRLISIIAAPDDNTKKAADQLFKKIEAGKLSAVTVDSFDDTLHSVPYSSGSNLAVSMTSLIELQQYLKASWMNDIGLNSNYNMKRESLNSGETGMNEDPLLPTPADMLECRKIAIAQINEMFGLDIRVELSSAWKKHEAIAESTVEQMTDEGELIDGVENEIKEETDIIEESSVIDSQPDAELPEIPTTPEEESESSDSSDGGEVTVEDKIDDIIETVEEIKETVDELVKDGESDADTDK